MYVIFDGYNNFANFNRAIQFEAKKSSPALIWNIRKNFLNVKNFCQN